MYSIIIVNMSSMGKKVIGTPGLECYRIFSMPTNLYSSPREPSCQTRKPLKICLLLWAKLLPQEPLSVNDTDNDKPGQPLRLTYLVNLLLPSEQGKITISGDQGSCINMLHRFSDWVKTPLLNITLNIFLKMAFGVCCGCQIK